MTERYLLDEGERVVWYHGDAEASINTDGVATGDVWDALAAPALLLGGSVRALILGYGGGTVARLLAHLRRCHITGVDPDPEAWKIADRWGNVPQRRVVGDGREFLDIAIERRERFDFIVEDIFEGFQKPRWVTKSLADLRELLTPNGVLVMNFVYGGGTRTATTRLRRLMGGPPAILEVAGVDNQIVVARHGGVDVVELDELIHDEPELAELVATGVEVKR